MSEDDKPWILLLCNFRFFRLSEQDRASNDGVGAFQFGLVQNTAPYSSGNTALANEQRSQRA